MTSATWTWAIMVSIAPAAKPSIPFTNSSNCPASSCSGIIAAPIKAPTPGSKPSNTCPKQRHIQIHPSALQHVRASSQNYHLLVCDKKFTGDDEGGRPQAHDSKYREAHLFTTKIYSGYCVDIDLYHVCYVASLSIELHMRIHPSCIHASAHAAHAIDERRETHPQTGSQTQSQSQSQPDNNLFHCSSRRQSFGEVGQEDAHHEHQRIPRAPTSKHICIMCAASGQNEKGEERARGSNV
jgi:hypothetical protein